MARDYIGYVEFLSAEEAEARKDEIALDVLRHERIKILAPFDLWEKSVVRGRESDSEAVMCWYQAILDLDSHAFENIPDVVAKYE